METIGTIKSIKLASFLTGGPNSFDIAAITVKENAGPATWLFYLWNSRDDVPALRRILQSQRLALIREAAFRGLTVHIIHDNNSSIPIDNFTVDIP